MGCGINILNLVLISGDFEREEFSPWLLQSRKNQNTSCPRGTEIILFILMHFGTSRSEICEKHFEALE